MYILFFEIEKGNIWRYRCRDYFIRDGFYFFTDLTTNAKLKLDETLYRGESEVDK